MGFKEKYLPGIVGFAYPLLIRFLGSTWRIKVIRDEETLELMRKYNSVVYAFWHSCLLPLTYTHRGRGIAVLVSEHTDGELIARGIMRLGFIPVRGSSTRRAIGGLKGMIDLAKKGYPVAITLDGPRGPAFRVKPGVFAIAREANIPVIPVGVSAKKKLVLKTWDNFMIPFPFTKVVVIFGEPFFVSSIDEPWLTEKLESIMRDLNDQANNLV